MSKEIRDEVAKGKADVTGPLLDWMDKELTGAILLDPKREYSNAHALSNLHLSRCYCCRELCVWRHEDIIYPSVTHDFEPNDDLSSAIKADFREANEILPKSPRGAAALLRLCLQEALYRARPIRRP